MEVLVSEVTVSLDTHVVVWLYEGALERISLDAQKAIDENECVISPVAFLELQYLYESKKITKQADEIFNELQNQIALTMLETSFKAVVQEAVKVSWTRDPFDRLIVAHAQFHRIPLITKDKKINKHYRNSIW